MRQPVLTPMQTQKTSGCGCLSGGCAMAGLVFLLLAGAVFWGAWSTLTGLRSMTSSSPQPIAIYNATQEEYQAVVAKTKAFETTYDSGQPAEIILSADEINTLIARNPDLADLRGHVFVTMHESRIEAQISAPLDMIRLFENSYFNGEASMSFVTENGQPHPVSVSIKARGVEFPTWLIRYITWKDFVQNLDLPQVSDSSGVFTNLNSLQVKDEKLIIHAQKKS